MRLSPIYAFGAYTVWAVFVAIQPHGSDAAAFWGDALRLSRFLAVAALLVLSPRIAFFLARAALVTAQSSFSAFLLGAGSMVALIVASFALIPVGDSVRWPQHVLTLIAAFGLGCIASMFSGRFSHGHSRNAAPARIGSAART